MLRLDPFTLLVASSLIALTLVLVVLGARVGLGAESRGLRSWLAGDLALLLGQSSTLLDALPGLFPMRTPPLTVSSGLIVAGVTLHLQAMRRHRGPPAPAWPGLVGALGFGVVVAAACAAIPATAGRAMLFHGVLLVVQVATLAVLWPARRAWGARLMAAASAFAVVVNALLFAAAVSDDHGIVEESTTGLLIGLAMTLVTVSGFLLWLHEGLRGRLLKMAATDALTGATNRLGVLQQLDRELPRAARSGRPVSIAMCDLDHFKRVNDRLGHAAGDAVLCEFVTRARALLRGSDVLARWGGEEFLVVMPETAGAEAVQVMERLCRAQRETPACAPRVTLSAGVASTADLAAGGDVDALLACADARLYLAKEARDCVVGGAARSGPPTLAGPGRPRPPAPVQGRQVRLPAP